MPVGFTCTSLLDPLDLDGAQPLAIGGGRLIFAHPGDDKLLIKIVDPQLRLQYMFRHRFKRWYKRFHRATATRGFIGEFSESVIVSARNAHWERLPLARVAGVAETSLGPGLLVEKISGPGGALAPTVRSLVQTDGLSAGLREMLDGLLQSLIDGHIVVNDLTGDNVVLGSNAQGKQGLFLIDGFGVKQKVPLYALSKGLNARHLREKFDEMVERLERADRLRLPAPAGPSSVEPLRVALF